MRFFLTRSRPEGSINRFGQLVNGTIAIRDRTRVATFGTGYQKAVAWTTDLALAERIAKMLNDDESPQWNLEVRVATLERWRRNVSEPNVLNVFEGG